MSCSRLNDWVRVYDAPGGSGSLWSNRPSGITPVPPTCCRCSSSLHGPAASAVPAFCTVQDISTWLPESTGSVGMVTDETTNSGAGASVTATGPDTLVLLSVNRNSNAGGAAIFV